VLPPASSVTGHNDNLQEIQSNVDFSYVRVLKMLYSPLESVRIIAGSALAAFSYNSLHNQNEIAQQGGVRFACFEDFLKSDDEYSRCNVAFQVRVSRAPNTNTLFNPRREITNLLA